MLNNYNYKGKKCIVTGGSGFIGQNIVKYLLDDRADVYVIDNFSYGAKKTNIDKRAKIITGDVRDRRTLEKLPSLNYNYFFHFAAPSSITLFNRDLEECLDITINGFCNAIDFCSRNKIRLIYPSSGSVYSGTDCPQSEKTVINQSAINSYAKAKLVLECIQKAYGSNCDSLGVRIFAGYGPSEKHKGDFASVVYMFCKQIIGGQTPVIFGDGNQKRDFIYIDDVIERLLILGQNCKEPIVNIGTGTNVSFNKIIETINGLSKIKVEAEHVKKPGIYLEETLADTKLLRKFCKGAKNTSIKEGIKQIIQSLGVDI